MTDSRTPGELETAIEFFECNPSALFRDLILAALRAQSSEPVGEVDVRFSGMDGREELGVNWTREPPEVGTKLYLAAPPAPPEGMVLVPREVLCDAMQAVQYAGQYIPPDDTNRTAYSILHKKLRIATAPKGTPA